MFVSMPVVFGSTSSSVLRSVSRLTQLAQQVMADALAPIEHATWKVGR